MPWGAAIVYSKMCLSAIEGLSPTPCHEPVEIILAKDKGFSPIISSVTRFTHMRPMGSYGGWYRGHVQLGGAARWLGLPLSFAIAKGIRLLFSMHPQRGGGYLTGYFRWGKQRCDIPAVQTAYQNRWKAWWQSLRRKPEH